MNRLFFLLGLITALVAAALVRQACCPKGCCRDWSEEECDPCRDRGIAD